MAAQDNVAHVFRPNSWHINIAPYDIHMADGQKTPGRTPEIWQNYDGSASIRRNSVVPSVALLTGKVLYHCSLKSVLLFPKISWHKTFSIMCLISLCDSSETMKPHQKWKARTGTTSEPCITVSNRKSLILEFKESGKYYPYHFDFDASFFWRNLRGVIRFQFHVSFLRTHRPKTPRVQYIKIVLWFPNLHLPVWIKAKPFQYTTTQIFSIYSL